MEPELYSNLKKDAEGAAQYVLIICNSMMKHRTGKGQFSYSNKDIENIHCALLLYTLVSNAQGNKRNHEAMQGYEL